MLLCKFWSVFVTQQLVYARYCKKWAVCKEIFSGPTALALDLDSTGTVRNETPQNESYAALAMRAKQSATWPRTGNGSWRLADLESVRCQLLADDPAGAMPPDYARLADRPWALTANQSSWIFFISQRRYLQLQAHTWCISDSCFNKSLSHPSNHVKAFFMKKYLILSFLDYIFI